MSFMLIGIINFCLFNNAIAVIFSFVHIDLYVYTYMRARTYICIYIQYKHSIGRDMKMSLLSE